MSKGDPIPAKFDPPEEKLLNDLKRRTGLTVSEIIRRSVRLLGMKIKELGPDWHAFVIEDLGADWPEHGARAFELPTRDPHMTPKKSVSYSFDLARKKKRQAARQKKSAA